MRRTLAFAVLSLSPAALAQAGQGTDRGELRPEEWRTVRDCEADVSRTSERFHRLIQIRKEFRREGLASAARL